MTVRSSDTPHDRILEAATALLASGGRDAVSTRAVSAAAGVQPQTIYRQFGDMRGLLNAVTQRGFSSYLASKTADGPTGDAVEDLRRGWDLHIDFGLSQPAMYKLMYADPETGGEQGGAASETQAILRSLVANAAAAGLLRISVEHAVSLISAAGVGVVLTLIASPPAERDLRLSTVAREATLDAMLTPSEGQSDLESARSPNVRAIALRAVLGESPARMSPGEKLLLTELLDRIGDGAP